jgi:hypothetical protein
MSVSKQAFKQRANICDHEQLEENQRFLKTFELYAIADISLMFAPMGLIRADFLFTAHSSQP